MKELYESIFIFVFMATLVSAAAAKPDLIVSKVTLTRDRGGIFVEKVEVTVTNGCRDSAAGGSYVLVTFRENEQPDSKAIYYTGNTVRALKGGKSQTQTFNVSEKKIIFGRYVIVEADLYKKIAEANEDNNWQTLFPDSAHSIISQRKCSS